MNKQYKYVHTYFTNHYSSSSNCDRSFMYNTVFSVCEHNFFPASITLKKGYWCLCPLRKIFKDAYHLYKLPFTHSLTHILTHWLTDWLSNVSLGMSVHLEFHCILEHISLVSSWREKSLNMLYNTKYTLILNLTDILMKRSFTTMNVNDCKGYFM